MFRRTSSSSRSWSARFFQVRTRFLLVVGLFPVLLIAQWHRTRNTLVWTTDSYLFLPYGTTSASQALHKSNDQSLSTSEDVQEVSESAFPPTLLDESSSPIVPAHLFDALRASGPPLPQLLPVTFAGTSRDSLLLDAMQRSGVLQVEHILLYNATTRRISTSRQHSLLVGPPRSITATDSSSRTRTASVAVTLIDWAGLERDCHVLERLLPILTTPAPGSPSSSHNATQFIVYWDITNNPRPRRCPQLEHDFEHVRRTFSYVQRSTVQHRRWNSKKQWVELGSSSSAGAPAVETSVPLHVPHPLREVFVQKLWKVARNRNVYHLSDLPHRRRKWHVTHHWRNGSVLPYSFLRNRVGHELQIMCHEQRLRCHLDALVGEPDDRDRTALERLDVAIPYVESLASSRIVVVTQHDEWEGHWRLLEGMASGALVLSDAIVALPVGLVNGTNVVLYDSVDNLRRLVAHYLQHDEERLRIARQGLEYALGSQRTWHQLERVLFGRPLTNARDPFADAPKKRKE